MAFNIYPDAATAALLGHPTDTPIALISGAAMSTFVPLAGHVGPDPSQFNLQTTFIRIAMSGSASTMAPPQVELRAVNPGASTEGTAVNITATSFPGHALLDGTNTTTAANAYWDPSPYSDNVYRLRVVISISGTTLKMKITNNTGSNRDFVWVVASTNSESQQPWMHVTPNAVAYKALVNQTPPATDMILIINNRGTGSLNVTGFTPAIPGTTPYASSGLPVTLAPNQSTPSGLMDPGVVKMGFNAPATISDTAPQSFVVNGDTGAVVGAAHNNQIVLSATTSKLEIGLALDDSGSMSWGAGGEDPPVGGAVNSRWSELQSALKLFLPLLGAFGENKGTFGIVKFPGRPDRPIDDVVSYDFFPGQTARQILSMSGMAALSTDIDAAQPFYQGTPMYYGLERLLTATPDYYATDAPSRDKNIRWLLLMSDGAWNSSPDPRGKIPDLAAKKIKVYAAGYGTAGEVDYPTLQALSTGPGTTPGGLSLQVDTSNPACTSPTGCTPTQLAEAFKIAIKNGLTSISNSQDPTATLYAGQAEARHPVIITPYDTRAAFLINWNSPNAERLELELLTPTCELLTASSVEDGGVPGVSFSGDLRHQLFVIDDSFLRNQEDPLRPRYGTWQMIVSLKPIIEIDLRFISESAAAPDSEQYAYDVLVESALKMELALDKAVYYAGDPIGISAALTLGGLPITNAVVKLELTKPGQAVANWLAAAPVSEAEYNEAFEQLSGKDASPIYVKAYAAKLKGITFDRFANATSIPMVDSDNNGIYKATFTNTETPDSYKLYVVATGITVDGVAFRRERSVEVTVGVRPDPAFTIFELNYDLLSQEPGIVTATVRITPRDRFGNVVLTDPATSQEILLRAQGAEFTGGLTTRFDGTYTTRLVHATGTTPIINLDVGGVPVFQDKVLPPVDKLRFVDRVVDFKPGGEGAEGANQHTDPKYALGDIRTKEPDRFVSLGAYGSLTVRIKGQIIVAQGDDDITIFTQPDSDLRSYRVEVSRTGRRSWEVLGDSTGVTQTFSLRQAGLKGARAIRITDTSGRTHGSDFEPLSTPGVSIRGVGIKKVRKATNGSATRKRQSSR